MFRFTLLATVVLAGTMAMGGPMYYAIVLSDQPIAYWRFDELSGPTAADASGHNHPGTYLGTFGLGVPSQNPNLGTAAQFNGSNTRVQVADHAEFDLGLGPLTIEFLFNAAVGAPRGDFFTYKGGGKDFGIHFDGNSAIDVWHDGYRLDNQAAVSRGVWHHLAFARQAGAGANNTTIYLDGNVYATFTDPQDFNIASDLLLGSNHSGVVSNPALVFNGRIDEFAIYNTALSQSRIQEHVAAIGVPEPASLSLLGLGALALLRRRKR